MVIDTSAVLAILLQEPDAAQMAAAIRNAKVRLMSALTRLEITMVIEGRKGPDGRLLLDEFFDAVTITIIAFDDDQCRLAENAFRRYGKGRHSAALNMADCVAYATAKATNAPLLYKGNDFAKTDVVSAG